MIRLVLLVLCLLGLADRALSADEVILRTTLDSETVIRVGQQVRLRVDVLGLDGWATIERLPRFKVSGAHVLRVETQGVRLNETIEGGSYTGQRYQWLVFPQRSGTLDVPAVPVQVSVKRFGPNVEPQLHSLETQAVDFEVAVPPGAEDLAGAVSTTRLQATQVTLEGLTLEVSPPETGAEGVSIEGSLSIENFSPKALAAGAAVLVLAVGLAGASRRWLLPAWHDYWERRRASELAYFKRFVDVAGTGNPRKALAALMRWIDRLDLPQSPARLETFAAHVGGEHAYRESSRLVSLVASDSDADVHWNWQPLVAAMKAARRQYLALSEPADSPTYADLPPLNPVVLD